MANVLNVPVVDCGLALTVEQAAERIRVRDPQLRALVSSRLDAALAETRARVAEPRRSVLDRVPFVLKDVWDTAGIPTTGGSWRYRDRVPSESAPVYRALTDAGAVLLGKSNLSDLAFTPESDNYLRGATANPHDARRTAGGSSGGAAAAVADRMAAFDWGSDFGGSIRLPAAFCGIFGLRLSASQWPVRGHFPPFPEELGLNAMGPLARDLATLTAVLDTLAPALRQHGNTDWRPTEVAVYAPDDFAAGAWSHFNVDAAHIVARLGLPHCAAPLPPPREVDRAFAAYLAGHLEVIFRGELAEIARAAATSVTVGAMVRDRRLHPSTARVLVTLAIARMTIYRDRAAAVRRVTELRTTMNELWSRGRVLLSPTSGFPAPKLGRTLSTAGCAAFVKLGNVVDATGLAVPWHTFANGMPRSIQLLGPPGSERALIDLARTLVATRTVASRPRQAG